MADSRHSISCTADPACDNVGNTELSCFPQSNTTREFACDEFDLG